MSDLPVEARPHVLFYPYLPLRAPVEVGAWTLSPLQAFEGPWLSERFERLSRNFIGAFQGPSNEPIEHPTVVARRRGGCDGAVPDPGDLVALRRAVEFTVLDQNPIWSAETSAGSIGAMQALTTDNADLHIWPIDLVDGAVAKQTGFVVSTLAGGYRIGSDLVITPSEELHIPHVGATLDSEIATAIYQTIAGVQTDSTDDDRARLARGIGWLAKAWRNTPSVSW